MKAAVLVLLVALSSVTASAALAQHDGRNRQGQGMSNDERQRMREDMRQVYRERGFERGGRPDRPERPRQLSPEERQKLRQDVQNANKDLRR